MYNYYGDKMIYLDYSATTPVLDEVLNSYIKVTKEYIGNANSLHSLGTKSKVLLQSATKQICELLNIEEEELIITSGATESNNTALKGIAETYSNRGKHIIVSKLEHPSIYKVCEYLEKHGYEISYVENNDQGLIDFDDLKNKVKEDTILVSICAVNSEVGIRQPLKTIRQIIKKQNPNTIFHSDMTQALGKVQVNFHDVDLASCSSHKIYGPKGIGILYKNKKINMEPLIHGTGKSNELRPGTPALPLIVSFSKALRIALQDLEKKEEYVTKLNKIICDELSKLDSLVLNKTNYSIPYILNLSTLNIKPETFVHALEENEVYVSTNTACSSGDVSTAIMAIYNDKQRAKTTIRISLSYLTSIEEINKFIKIFKTEYNKLNKFMGDKL